MSTDNDPSMAAGEHPPKVILMTGANAGLGFEASRRLLADGNVVCMAARDRDRGQRAADALGGFFVQLDVTDDDSVMRAAGVISEHFGRVDVLVNNAATPDTQTDPEHVTVDEFKRVYETNVFGVVRVTHAFLPLLRRSSSPSIINLGSESGSFQTVTNPGDARFRANGLVYGSSKAALSMLTLQYSKHLQGIQVNAITPGYTKTNFNGNAGTQTLTEGTDALVHLIADGRKAGTGNFYDRHGTVGW